MLYSVCSLTTLLARNSSSLSPSSYFSALQQGQVWRARVRRREPPAAARLPRTRRRAGHDYGGGRWPVALITSRFFVASARDDHSGQLRQGTGSAAELLDAAIASVLCTSHPQAETLQDSDLESLKPC